MTAPNDIGTHSFLLPLSNMCHWQNVWVKVPGYFEVWQRALGSDIYTHYKIELNNWQGTADDRRDVQTVLQCVECKAVWPKINTLGVAWAMDYELVTWPKNGRLRCACCAVGSGGSQPRSFVDGVRIIDF